MGANAPLGRYVVGKGCAVIDVPALVKSENVPCAVLVVNEWWCRKPHYAGVFSLKAIVG